MIFFHNVKEIQLALLFLFCNFQPPETNVKKLPFMFEHEESVSKSDNDAGQKQKSNPYDKPKNRGEEAYLRITNSW